MPEKFPKGSRVLENPSIPQYKHTFTQQGKLRTYGFSLWLHNWKLKSVVAHRSQQKPNLEKSLLKRMETEREKRLLWIHKLLQSVSRLRQLCSCRHRLPFRKKGKNDSKEEIKSPQDGAGARKKLCPSEGTTSLCPAEFKNCYRPATLLYHLISLLLNNKSFLAILCLSHHIVLVVPLSHRYLDGGGIYSRICV